MRRLIAAVLLVGGLLVTQASSCGVQVGPPAPTVTLLNSCHVPGTLWSYFTYHVGGEPGQRWWVWLHTTTGDSEAQYLGLGGIYQSYAVGEGWVHVAGGAEWPTFGVSAPGGHFTSATKECPA